MAKKLAKNGKNGQKMAKFDKKLTQKSDRNIGPRVAAAP
jgi:hypothetical protein